MRPFYSAFSLFAVLGVVFLCLSPLNTVGASSDRAEKFVSFHTLLQNENIINPAQFKPAEVVGNTDSVKERAKLSHRRDIKSIGRSNKDAFHKVIFAVQLNRVAELEQRLHDISDINHPNYGRHLSQQEILDYTDHFASTNTIQEYLEHLNASGFPIRVLSTSLHGEYISAEAKLSVWEHLFSTQFFEFGVQEGFHDDELSHVRFHRAEHYSLPSGLQHHVRTVFNTVQIPDIRKLRRANLNAQRRSSAPFMHTGAEEDSQPDNKQPLVSKEVKGYVTPALLNRIYNIDNTNGGGRGSQAVYETIGQTFSPTDLHLFQKQFGLMEQAVAVDIGGHSNNNACKANHGDDCVEANLDVQYLMAVAQNVPTTYYYWDGEDFLLEWIQQVASMADPPKVFSISYGVDEGDLADSYFAEFDLTALKLGLRGVTILASSGDDGAVSPNAGSSSLYCGYSPSFPATSPYVTAVGGTMGPENEQTEVVCQSDKSGIITSGGGFSTVYPAPAWQRTSLDSYFAKVGARSTSAGVAGSPVPLPGYNTGGRGYPDVSAVAFNYIVAVYNNFTAVSGTSASSPVMAGMVSLVNSARLAAGKSTLGWLNPALYALHDQFALDITEGANNCAASARVCCQQGFGAIAGWDPVSGLGSVNFQQMKQALVDLPAHINEPTPAPTAIPGQPTVQPTIAVPVSPTTGPTQYPTVGKGWMHLSTYSSTECGGDVTEVSGVPTETCLAEYDSSGKVAGSMVYTCNAVQATLTTFSDGTCSASKKVGSQNFGVGCALSIHDTPYYYSEGQGYSTRLSCESRATEANALIPPSPESTNTKTYVLHSSFDSKSGCDGALLSQYDFYLERYCFESSKYSYQFIYPDLILYTGSGCKSKKPQKEALPTECSVLSTDDDGNYYGRRLSAVVQDGEGSKGKDSEGYEYYGEQYTSAFYEVWSHATSRLPSVAHTAFPSLPPVVAPSLQPTTLHPTVTPSVAPSVIITVSPTVVPGAPTFDPTVAPTALPTFTFAPTVDPTTAPPSTRPTVAPSIARSERPSYAISKSSAPSGTEAPRDFEVTLSIDQALAGITAADFKETGSGAAQVFKHAVAKTLSNGIKASDVDITSVSDQTLIVPDVVGMTRQQQASHLRNRARPRPEAQYVWVCDVSYTVKFSTLEAGFATADQAFNAMLSQLWNALNSGRFDEHVQEFAVLYHSSAMASTWTPGTEDAMSASFDYLDVTVPVLPTEGNDGGASGENGLSTVSIALLVIGAIAFVSLIAMVRYLINNKLRASGDRYDVLGTDSLHPGQDGSSPRSTSSDATSDGRGPSASTGGRKGEIELSTVISPVFSISDHEDVDESESTSPSIGYQSVGKIEGGVSPQLEIETAV